jgi:hypothetical protein
VLQDKQNKHVITSFPSGGERSITPTLDPSFIQKEVLLSISNIAPIASPQVEYTLQSKDIKTSFLDGGKSSVMPAPDLEEVRQFTSNIAPVAVTQVEEILCS